MAQRHLESDEPGKPPETGPRSGGDVLGAYLRAQATEFLRSLRRHRESGAADGTADAARDLRRAARRISGTLHTFRPLLDPEWSDALRPELAWLSGTLAQEHAYTDRLARLNEALQRLTTAGAERAGTGAGQLPRQAPAATPLTLGAAKAAALLDRQLGLARTRAHSTALQSLGSSRFHAVADLVAVLASDVPLTGSGIELPKLAGEAESRLAEAAGVLRRADHRRATPYDPDADAPWHHVRLLLRLHRYAQEVVPCADEPRDPVRLSAAARALDAHRDAAEAAAAAAHAARTPRIAPATAYALGVLHADQRHQVEAARNAFGRAWQRETVGTP
ncbi:CHAD domain-containing protein [Streptomyces sp. SID8379]|uniref:CHAD domain-containing protein n=1 Tax=unclassified Streptomyces TaxID=2593676 RepID=UPI00037BC04E|nr:CHAD domain-containing protein [Streptomyces sp. HmicA12]MYW67815.1 CHAD domain-containing protein [Streptomyces sp. SID8379]